MSFSQPSIELNLYKVEVVRHMHLDRDGIAPILPNYNDSPFMHPDILPSTRVNRWETVPYLENYVELDYGDRYKLRLHNYTIHTCRAEVTVNGRQIGRWSLQPQSNIVINGPHTGYFAEASRDSREFRTSTSTFADAASSRFQDLDHGFQFAKYAPLSDMIEVHFTPDSWSDADFAGIDVGASERIFKQFRPDAAKTTIIYVRLVSRRTRPDMYETGVKFRAECPSYIG